MPHTGFVKSKSKTFSKDGDAGEVADWVFQQVMECSENIEDGPDSFMKLGNKVMITISHFDVSDEKS